MKIKSYDPLITCLDHLDHGILPTFMSLKLIMSSVKMRILLRKIAFSILFVCIYSVANADIYTINKVGVGYGEAFFFVTPAPQNTAGCEYSERIQFDTTVPLFKEQYSAALAAHMGGKQVELTIHSSKCINYRPVLFYLQVKS